MTPEETMSLMVDAYDSARRFDHIPYRSRQRLIRGKARSSSGMSEDIVAAFVADCDRTIDCIQVAKDITPLLPSDAPHRRFEGDIVVIRKDQIDAIIDVKTDSGHYRRALGRLAEDHAETARRCAGHYCTITDNQPGSATPIRYRLADDLTYDIVLMSGENTTASLLARGREEVAPFAERSQLFVLSSGAHPNNYEFSPSETMQQMHIHHEEFHLLKKRVRRPRFRLGRFRPAIPLRDALSEQS